VDLTAQEVDGSPVPNVGVSSSEGLKRRGSLARDAYTRLRDAIISGDLQPDEPLSEVALAARLGISRTPVREALARLAVDGLVVAQPGRGSRVSGISLTDINDLFEVREALEVLAAQLASRNLRGGPAEIERLIDQFEPFESTGGEPSFEQYYALTAAMDDTLIAKAGNRRLEEALREVWGHSRRLRQYASKDVERLEASAREHRIILRAICDRNLDAVEAGVRTHMQNSRKALLAKVLGGQA
jgi:DNA-binding GntR family transcriptional regulator